ADWMRTAEGQQKMRDFWEDVRRTITEILTLVKEAGILVAQTTDLINRAFPTEGAPVGVFGAANSASKGDFGGALRSLGGVAGDSYASIFRAAGVPGANGGAINMGIGNIKKTWGWLSGLFGGDGGGDGNLPSPENGEGFTPNTNGNGIAFLPNTVPGPNVGGGRSGGQKQYTREEWEKTFGDVEEFDRQLEELQLKSIETQRIGSSEFGTFGSNAAQALVSLGTGDFSNFKSSLGDLAKNILGTTEDGQTNWGNLGSKIGEVVGNITEKIFPGLKEGLGTLLEFGRGIVEGFGGNWDRLKGMAAGPINWIIDHVINGALKSAWDAVANVFGLDKWDGVNRIEISGTGKSEGGPELVQRYATGGHVRGRGGPTDDLIDAKLSNGEYVMRASAVDKIGVANLDRLNNNPLIAKGKVLAEGMFTGIRMKVGGSVDEAVARAKGFMQHESGKPYQYGGTGNPSWDCSGLWSGIVNELSGRPATSGRLFNTESDFESMGWNPGLDGRVTIGIMRGGGGENSHMAGTIDGTNAESSGDNGVQWGGPARGSDNSMFGLQYTLQELAGQFASGGQGGGGLFASAANAARRLAASTFDKAVTGIGAGIPDFGPSLVGQLPKAAFNAIKDALTAAIRGSMNSGSGSGSFEPGAGAEQWRQMMIDAYKNQGYDPTPAKIDAWVRQIHTESGGDPNIAQQIVDVNGTGEAAGVGLGQMIPATWQAYRDPALPDDRRDPWAMLNAMARYGEQKFGDRLLDVIGQGHGYALGGIIPGYSPGQDKFQVGVSGGESIMRPEWTRAVGSSFVDGMNSIARKQGVEGVQRAMGMQMAGMFAEGGVFTPEEQRLYLEGRISQFGTQAGDIAKKALPEILGVQGTPLDPNHRYWQAAMDIQSAAMGAQAVGPIVSDQLGSNSIQSAIAEGGRVIEEHIHYHVTDIDEAIRKERIRQKQQATSFTGR
uniref:hypothetical protein n=1 Tax=Rhodococcus qingshengii TaxID=334542 RepID=UPI001C4E1BE1